MGAARSFREFELDALYLIGIGMLGNRTGLGVPLQHLA